VCGLEDQLGMDNCGVLHLAQFENSAFTDSHVALSQRLPSFLCWVLHLHVTPSDNIFTALRYFSDDARRTHEADQKPQFIARSHQETTTGTERASALGGKQQEKRVPNEPPEMTWSVRRCWD